MDSLLSDLRYISRNARRRLGLTASILATLALGIGANTAIFSVVDGVLLKPLPYTDPESLVVVRVELPAQETRAPRAAGPEILDLRARAPFLDALGGIWARPGALTDDASEPEEIEMGFVTAGFLSVLGVEPLLGRDILPEEDVSGAPPVIVLSHGLWQRRYGGDRDIIGSAIEMDGKAHTVVGVMPAGFTLLLPPDARVPSTLQAFVSWGGGYDEMSRGFRVFTVVGRLAPGTSAAEAQAELSALAPAIASDHPEDYDRSGLGLHAEPLHSDVTASIRPTLTALWATVALVLLIACANVANLLLLRATTMEQEILVRSAIGASRGRLVRQLVTESVLLAVAGGLLGVLLAIWAVDLLVWLSPGEIPRLGTVGVSARALGFTGVAAVVSGMGIGLLSALHLTRPREGFRLRNRSAGDGGRLRRAIVVFEIALTLVLLVGAGLLVGSFRALAGVELGYSTESVTTMKLSLIDYAYPYSGPEKIAEFYRQLHAGIDDLPGVTASGATTRLPLDGVAAGLGPYAYDTPDGDVVEWESVAASYRTVTPGYVEALRLPLLEGRSFTWSDDLDHPDVAIVDEVLAATAWPGESAVGKRIRLLVQRRGIRPEWFEVVGVVGAARHQPGLISEGQIYLPHSQSPQRTMTLAVRSERPAPSLGADVRSLVERLEATQPVHSVRAMTDYRDLSLSEPRFTTFALLIFSGLALTLASLGVYAVIAFDVARRTRELGIRLALGATPARLLTSVLERGLMLVGPGLLAGLAGAIGFARILRGLLFEVSPTDPKTLIATTAFLALVAIAACWVPARRALSLEPSKALREE